MEEISTITNIRATIYKSSLLTVVIEPNIKDSKLVPPGVKSESIDAIAIPVLITIAVAMSPYLGNFLLKLSIAKLANMQIRIDVHIGFIPKIRPSPIPAKELWLRASPIIDVFLLIIIIPIIGIIIASIIPIAKALLIKENSSINKPSFL